MRESTDSRPGFSRRAVPMRFANGLTCAPKRRLTREPFPAVLVELVGARALQQVNLPLNRPFDHLPGL